MLMARMEQMLVQVITRFFAAGYLTFTTQLSQLHVAAGVVNLVKSGIDLGCVTRSKTL